MLYWPNTFTAQWVLTTCKVNIPVPDGCSRGTIKDIEGKITLFSLPADSISKQYQNVENIPFLGFSTFFLRQFLWCFHCSYSFSPLLVYLLHYFLLSVSLCIIDTGSISFQYCCPEEVWRKKEKYWEQYTGKTLICKRLWHKVTILLGRIKASGVQLQLEFFF